jgi:hypothetical protein
MILFILDVQVCKLLPVVLFVADTDKFGYVNASWKQIEIFHELLGTVLGIQDSKLRECPLVSTF